MRFAAAFLVTIFHLGKGLSPVETGTWFGWVGVPIFFVLSGFVITYSAQDATPASFLKSRVVRLMPGVWICAGFMLVIATLVGAAPAPAVFLKTLVLWPTGPWIEPVYWTLPVEIVFYGLVLAVLLAGHKDRLPAVLTIVGTVSSIYWVVRVASAHYHFSLWSGTYAPRYLLLEHGCLFALGGLLWATLIERPTAVRLLAMAVFMGAGLVSLVFSTNAFGGGGPLAPMLALLLAVGAIVASVKLDRPSRYARAIRLVGLTTYPLYLLHMTSGGLMIEALRSAIPDIAAFAIAVVAVIVLAALVAAFVEPRVQAWLRRLLNWRPARVATAS